MQDYPEEAAWLELARAGDEDAFASLVEVYQRPVYNLCYRMLGNPGDAEDAAQETFIRAYRALMSYDPQRKFSTWILSIASNYCIDQHRRRRLQTFSLDGLPTPDLPDDQPGLESLVTNREHEARVQELLASLAPVDRNAVVLRYWYDCSYEEIAESLDISVSAVKSRLHRARRDLAAVWLSERPALELQVERKAHESPAYR